MNQIRDISLSETQLLPHVIDTGSVLTDVPRALQPWLEAEHHPQVTTCLDRIWQHGGWRWPAKPTVFISDPHADAEGFLRSLTAAGVIWRDGRQVHLTEFGRQVRIVLGGDTLDKGPSNLDLLDAIAAVRNIAPDLQILAGNHDLRMRMAITALSGPRTVLREHLFVRMGRKILPALREVLDRFVTVDDLAALPEEAACKARLFPGPDWASRFAATARAEVRPAVIEREIAKLLDKLCKFEGDCAQSGMSYREILAAALKCQSIFFEPGGAYAWFFNMMDVVARSGSLLFVHAGVCDSMCETLASDGPAAVNARYRKAAEDASLEFYFGPLANLVRTKYRESDCHLTEHGVGALLRAGIFMIVQGHVNNHEGQRLLAKRGLLHLEGDITLDRATRAVQGLDGIGAGATLIFPSGDVIGLSRDYPWAKHFAPERTNVLRGQHER